MALGGAGRGLRGGPLPLPGRLRTPGVEPGARRCSAGRRAVVFLFFFFFFFSSAAAAAAPARSAGSRRQSLCPAASEPGAGSAGGARRGAGRRPAGSAGTAAAPRAAGWGGRPFGATGTPRCRLAPRPGGGLAGVPSLGTGITGRRRVRVARSKLAVAAGAGPSVGEVGLGERCRTRPRRGARAVQVARPAMSRPQPGNLGAVRTLHHSAQRGSPPRPRGGISPAAFGGQRAPSGGNWGPARGTSMPWYGRD
jgi:hypothetical protein